MFKKLQQFRNDSILLTFKNEHDNIQLIIKRAKFNN